MRANDIEAKYPSWGKGYEKTHHPLLGKYRAIKARCNNPNTVSWERYGKKGTRVEWRAYREFEKDMYPSYLEHVAIYGKVDTTIDRVDSGGNYSKENCRWATRKEQSNNRKNIVKYLFNGREQTLTEWSKELGINFFTLYQRVIEYKWPLERALNPEKRINQYL